MRCRISCSCWQPSIKWAYAPKWVKERLRTTSIASAAQFSEPLLESDLEKSGAQPGSARLAENLIETPLRACPQPHGLAYLRLALCSEEYVAPAPVATAFLQRQPPLALQRTQIVSERGAIHDELGSQLRHGRRLIRRPAMQLDQDRELRGA